MPNALLVFEGDSLTAVNGNAAIGVTNGWALKLVNQIGIPAPAALSSSNLAVSGSTTATMTARAAAVDALFDATRPWQVLFVWIGTNDLTVSGRTPTATYNDIVSYCQARRAVGFKVVVFTLTPNHGSADVTFEADRQTINTNIRANWATFADGVVDDGADVTIGLAAASFNTALFYDGLHLTAQGQRTSTFLAGNLLQALIPGVTMAVPATAIWEGRASGAGVSDSNGGAWAPVTVSTFSGTDLVVDASLNTKVTSVTHNFVAADVGARIQISGGTGWTTGFYTINSVASNAATLSSSPAATSATGGTWAMVGVDRSQQNSPQVVIDNSTITTSIAANVITFTGYTPTVADVGNAVKMLTGTNVTVGWYFITGFTSTTWTVAGSVALPTSGTTTNATGNMGGALLTLTALASGMVASNKAYCTGAFTSAANITFTQSVNPTGALPYTRLIGYGATRGDSTHATLTLTAGSLTGINATGINGFSVEQIDVNCNSQTTSIGILTANARCRIINCLVSNFTSKGISCAGTLSQVQGCEVTGGTSAATAAIDISGAGNSVGVIRCNVHDNACPGIKTTGGGSVFLCLVTNNTGASSDGIQIQEALQVSNCTIHGNGRDGIRSLGTSSDNLILRGNVITNNTGFGITGTLTTAMGADSDFDGNAYFSNNGGVGNAQRTFMDSTAGVYGVNPYVNTHDVFLTVSPYVGPTSGSTANFALNNTAGGGAACRASAPPTTWPGNTGTTSYEDMGAVQTRGSNTSPSAGGSPGVIMATG